PCNPTASHVPICSSILRSPCCPRNQLDGCGRIQSRCKIPAQSFTAPHDAGFHRADGYLKDVGYLLIAHILDFPQDQSGAEDRVVLRERFFEQELGFTIDREVEWGFAGVHQRLFAALDIVVAVFDASLAGPVTKGPAAAVVPVATRGAIEPRVQAVVAAEIPNV